MSQGARSLEEAHMQVLKTPSGTPTRLPLREDAREVLSAGRREVMFGAGKEGSPSGSPGSSPSASQSALGA